MKKHFFPYALSGVLVLGAMTGCNSDKPERLESSGSIVVNLKSNIAPSSKLKLSNDEWETTDRVGLFMKKAGEALSASGAVFSAGANLEMLIDNDRLNSTSSLFYPKEGNVDFIAYYPYTSPFGAGYTIDVDLSEQATVVDMLYSDNVKNQSPTSEPVTLNFDYSLAKLTVTVTGAQLSQSHFDNMGVSVDGMFTQAKLQLADGTFTGHQGKKPIALRKTGEAPASVSFEALVLPAAADNLTLLFTVGGISYPFVLKDKSFDAATEYKFNFNLNLITRTVTLLNAVIIPRDAAPARNLEITNEDSGYAYTVPIWQCLEIPFTSAKAFSNPLYGADLCEMDVIFTHTDGTTISRPAFWDGGNGTSFKVRFAPTKLGKWTYQTVCEQEPSLDGLNGWVDATVYNGALEIYKRGFITISADKRYFTYKDGTPFFYLGDTHWSLPYEAFDESNVQGIASQFKHMVDTRIQQGFTVFQSEPIQEWRNNTGALDQTYDLTTFDANTANAFVNLDRKFKYIADKGMVHANAQLDFVTVLGVQRSQYPDAYIEKLTRYWVARYGAYPVMWTVAQECDNDYYYENPEIRVFAAGDNPWHTVAQSLHKYDAYRHPLTAHMEYSNGNSNTTNQGTIASNSSFKNIEGHNWFAAQWVPEKTSQLDFRIPRDFWNSQPPRPTVNYEGHYDNFWTNTQGARMQGWTAYLNGMMGHGYGAAGIWTIINSYPDDLATGYGLDETTTGVTLAQKRMPWYEGLMLPAAEQLGKHMRGFFEELEWWRLTPRFDDSNWSSLGGTFGGLIGASWYSIATIDNNVYVCYFYNTNTNTGTLRNLNTASTYTAQWYNPQTGVYTNIGDIASQSNGYWTIPVKPSTADWVLLVKVK